jgi:hypothetical protein
MDGASHRTQAAVRFFFSVRSGNLQSVPPLVSLAIACIVASR